MLTLVRIFKFCSQDSCTVLAVMADVIRQLKIAMPGLKTVCYWQDNAGCYHCGTTLVCAAALGHEGVKIRRLDFFDPQGGKAACDRKAATLRSHIRIYLNAGNDIETPEQLRDAILSSGAVPGVNVALCETVQVPKVLPSKDRGYYSPLSNVGYKEEGLLVWRAYGIGDGKLIPTDKLHCPSPSDLPTLTGATRSYSSAFTSVKETRIKASVRDPDPPVKRKTVTRRSSFVLRRVLSNISEIFINVAVFRLWKTPTCS